MEKVNGIKKAFFFFNPFALTILIHSIIIISFWGVLHRSYQKGRVPLVFLTLHDQTDFNFLQCGVYL